MKAKKGLKWDSPWEKEQSEMLELLGRDYFCEPTEEGVFDEFVRVHRGLLVVLFPRRGTVRAKLMVWGLRERDRIPPVIVEYTSGCYDDFLRSWKSAIRHLCSELVLLSSDSFG